MIKLLIDSSLGNVASLFDARFRIACYASKEELEQQILDQDILLCRSTVQVTEQLLKGSTIRCVATASSGIDHIDETYLKSEHISLIDAKGSNARAVTDYVIACVAYVQITQKFSGLRVGVVGVGAVGARVVQRLQALGFQVVSYDPPRALQDTSFVSCDVEALHTCDLLCLHPNLHHDAPYASSRFIDDLFISKIKPGTVIINASRGQIVDEYALLSCGKSLIYCTDVYAHEPTISKELVAYSTLCTPHIAGHSIEARHRALEVVSERIHQFFDVPMSPVMPSNTLRLTEIAGETSWQHTVLSLYNPKIETTVLQNAEDISATFLELRRAHHYRHEFSGYVPLSGNDVLEAALGRNNECL